MPLLWSVLACLPANSLTRHEDLPTERYQLSALMQVSTSKIPNPTASVPGFSWELSATLDRVYTRTFRDHSIGSLVRFQDVKSEVVIDGQRTGVPSKLEGLLVELRTFERGEVLAVPGADGALGVGGHIETLDILWPMLAPHVQGSENELVVRTGWPVGQSRWLGYERLSATGDQTEDRENRLLQIGFSGDTTNTSYIGTSIRMARVGTLRANLTVDTQKAIVAGAQATAIREVDLRCLGVTQAQNLTLTLTHLGAGPPVPIVPFSEVDSMGSDALPVTLQDGRMVGAPVPVSIPDPFAVLDPSTAIDCQALVPLVIFPDTWSEQERSKILRGG